LKETNNMREQTMLKKVGWNLLKIGNDRLCLLPCGAREGKKEVRGKKDL
jgi:hypothetical protein